MYVMGYDDGDDDDDDSYDGGDIILLGEGIRKLYKVV